MAKEDGCVADHVKDMVTAYTAQVATKGQHHPETSGVQPSLLSDGF